MVEAEIGLELTDNSPGSDLAHLKSPRLLLFLGDGVLVDRLGKCRPGGVMAVFSFTENNK